MNKFQNEPISTKRIRVKYGYVPKKSKKISKIFEFSNFFFSKYFWFFFLKKYKIFNFRENYITTICDEHTDKNFDKFRAYANCVGCQDEIQTSELNISWTQRTIFLEFLYFFTSFQSSKFSRSRRLLPNKKLNLMPASSTGHLIWLIS